MMNGNGKIKDKMKGMGKMSNDKVPAFAQAGKVQIKQGNIKFQSSVKNPARWAGVSDAVLIA